MHTAQDNDKRLAELWDKNMVPAGFCGFYYDHDCWKPENDAIRKFASDLVDGKFQTLKAERDAALKELAALKGADVPDTQPAETEDERNGREIYEEWKQIRGIPFDWAEITSDFKRDWIAFAKRRPKVVPPTPKLREPGQVLCDAMQAYLRLWSDRDDKQQLNAIAIALGIEAQP